MEKRDVTMLFKRIKRVYSLFYIPGAGQEDELRQMIDDWLRYLRGVPVETVNKNLDKYVSNPDNKQPPHPGILARSTADRYQEFLRNSATHFAEDMAEMNTKAVPPPAGLLERVKNSVSGK
ncbi:hypothetical protein EBB07_00890 [Paenibacillaceae bacterium]|nr:hypothetical protein EBB07_00890 [Paenibacillaceae bacterium]